MSIRYETRDQVAYITIDNTAKGKVLDKKHADELS